MNARNELGTRLMQNSWLRWMVGFVAAALLLRLWGQWFYRIGPKKAYDQLAEAFESENVELARALIYPDTYSSAGLQEIAQIHGGMKAFGQGMKTASDMKIYTHMLATVDIFATMYGRRFMVMFVWIPSPKKPNGWRPHLIVPNWNWNKDETSDRLGKGTHEPY